MSHTKLRPHFTFDEEKLKDLKKIAPEAFADGQVNWETLKEALGEYIEDEGPDSEHFGLFWPGKKRARKIASIPSKKTITPHFDLGVDSETTQNIFIEGENLEALKLLQKSYAGKIKIIYIDPPYNTGNDFVYHDDYKEGVEDYLKRTGHVDEEGKVLTTNKKADGRFHSNWLNMIYPRLRLARNLLSEDGLILINIDHNENAHLKLILNEVFGEENFLADVIWKHTQQSKNDESYFSRQYNNLLVYSKSEDLQKLRFPRTEENNKNYSNPDNDPKGLWRSGDVRSPHYRKTLCFKIKTPSGKIINPPENGWRWSEAAVQEKIESGEIIFNKEETKIIRKIYLADQEGRTPENVWVGEDYGTTRGANAEIKELFDGEVPFDTPKPTALIVKILDLIYDEKDFIVLDFFAGSGTTAHAVYKKNLSDNGKRSYICVQLDEPVKSGTKYKTISSVARDRIKKAIKKLKQENKKADIDWGFRYFKIDNSNFKQWKNYEGQSVKELEKQFEMFTTPLVDDWSEDRLFYEVLLIEGFPLDSAVEKLKEYKKNTVSQVTSDFCEHKLLLCLDKKVFSDTINNLKLTEDDIFICLDSAISDEEKVRLSDKGFLKTI